MVFSDNRPRRFGAVFERYAEVTRIIINVIDVPRNNVNPMELMSDESELPVVRLVSTVETLTYMCVYFLTLLALYVG